MKHVARIIGYLVLGLAVCIAYAPLSYALSMGQGVPSFALQDLNGKKYELSAMKKAPMMVVYFFDAQSRPSQEGLLSLDQLAKKYKDAELTVWAITRSPKDRVADFVSKTKPGFPVLLDTSNVSDLYEARLILPTVCILGPDLKLRSEERRVGKEC
jgi:peroxiredoxin